MTTHHCHICGNDVQPDDYACPQCGCVVLGGAIKQAAGYLGSATFSRCGAYRYDLVREWNGRANMVAFIGLNPSTADADENDPTIRRCIGFARSWGHTGLAMLNVYALRSTDPRGLWSVDDPVGPQNDDLIQWWCGTVTRVVCAWGTHAKPIRVRRVMQIIGDGATCLGRTKHGCPKHPLYLRADTPLVPMHEEAGE